MGFASGLLGIGGCFIMVPVQFWVLTSMGVGDKLAILVAFGTNLMVVLPTAASGAYRHHTKGAVLWEAAVVMGVTGALGSAFGAYVATLLPGQVLKVIFGATILLGAVRMLTARPPGAEERPPAGYRPYVLWGLPLGFAVGLVGIGGGVVMIPVMVIVLRFSMHRAVGTSTAMMVFTATGGVVSYMVNGWGVEGLPEHSVGYVNLLQWALLAVTSIPMAQVGAHFAHRLPGRELRHIFIAVMVYVGLKMIGLFSWLGLPI